MLRFCLTVSAALCLSIATQGAVILNENFNELTPQLTATAVGAFSTIGGTNVDIVGGGLFGNLCAAPESGNCVDMDGSNGLSQGILQTTVPISLTPGVNYFLSFDLIGSGRGNTTSTTVSLGPYSQTFVLASNDVSSGIIVNQLVTVSAPTMANLTFTSNTPGNIGSVLDNVVISTSAVTGVPEPASIVLLASALLCLGCGRRLIAR